jgi:hypothetical protein
VGLWTVRTWLSIAAAYGPGQVGQTALRLSDPGGWSKYLSKHASRGVEHYQRQGTPPGWTNTGRLWGKSSGDSWPVVEPIEAVISDVTMRRVRRLVRSYVVAEARSAYLAQRARSTCSGRCARSDKCKTCAALRRWVWARRMLRCPDRGLSAVRGMSEWVPGPVLLQFALLAGWSGELKASALSEG